MTTNKTGKTGKQGHTPGPWHYAGFGEVKAGAPDTVDATRIQDMGNAILIASVRGRTQEEGNANARLIAAAPTQRAILKRIEAKLDRWALHLPTGPKGKDSDFAEIAAEVRAALRLSETGNARTALLLLLAFTMPFIGTLLAQFGGAIAGGR